MHTVVNHPVHMVDKNGKINPSSFIPFCSFGDNKFFNNLTDYHPDLKLPVCDMFRPRVVDGRLCYKANMTGMAAQRGKGLGINFLMDYNQERMDRIYTEDIEDNEAMIYIETMGKLSKISL